MRKIFKLTLMTALLAILMVSPALAKKAPVDRTVVDGVTLAEVKTNSQVSPYYPATARPSKAYGEVVVAVEVDEKGKVSGVDVLSSIGEDLGFEVSAKDAVRQWRFQPFSLDDGRAVELVTTVAVEVVHAPVGQR